MQVNTISKCLKSQQKCKNMLSWRLEARERREYIQHLTSFYYEFTLVITFNIAYI